mmetsp:Transcript_20984/g.80971  ORF Transcript_20984/g.80971 Transcript_20984/m.80971 type:complete len:253 (+) Transcript_20984:2136-2894(+)
MKAHRAVGLGANELVHQRIIAVTQLVRRPLGHDPPVGNHRDLIGDAKGLVQVMRHDDAGQPQGIVEVADQPRRHPQGDRVEAGEGLVVEHQVRVQCDGACQRDAARHAAGDFTWQQVARTAQADGIELHQHQVADHGLRQVGVLAQREGDVLEHAQIGEQGAELEQHAHASAHGIQAVEVERCQVLPVEQHLASQRLQLAPQQPQDRRLAAPGGADQCQHLAPLKAEIDAVQDHAVTVAAADIAQFDQGSGG